MCDVIISTQTIQTLNYAQLFYAVWLSTISLNVLEVKTYLKISFDDVNIICTIESFSTKEEIQQVPKVLDAGTERCFTRKGVELYTYLRNCHKVWVVIWWYTRFAGYFHITFLIATPPNDWFHPTHWVHLKHSKQTQIN